MADNPILLVDARNLLYRAIYVEDSRKHALGIAVGLLADEVVRFRPSRICICWDAPSDTIWRRKIHADYKTRTEKHNEARDRLVELQPLAMELFACLGTLQFHRDYMEADDLIYAACRVLFPQKVVIMSSDSDYLQIVYRMPNVKLYDHRKQKIVDHEGYDPIITKALAGDKSDTIDGYDQIGPVRSKALALSSDELHAFLMERGPQRYIRNLMLIDLSLCRDLLKNVMYIQFALANKSERMDRTKLYELTKTRGVNGIVERSDRCIVPFEQLGNQT